MPAHERVGTTPFELAIPPVAGDLVFAIERRGFHDETVTMASDRDGARALELRARARRRDRARPDATTLQPGSTLNPFEP